MRKKTYLVWLMVIVISFAIINFFSVSGALINNSGIEKSVEQARLSGLTAGFEFSIKVEPSGEIYINESEFHKNKKRSYHVGHENFAPKPLKGRALNSHFKSLNLSEDNIYALMQFETSDGDPTSEHIQILREDNISLFEYHGDHTYFAKIPRLVLETKSYDFVRWIGVVEDSQSKIRFSLNDYLASDPNRHLKILIVFYESSNYDQIKRINNLSDKIISRINSYIVTMETNVNNIKKLAKFGFIKEIWLMPTYVQYLDSSTSVVSADYVWAYPNNASGITVGVIDGGIQHNHDHFDSVTIYDAYDYAGGDNNPESLCGESNCSNGIDDDSDGKIDEGTHGVHVAGIVSGQGSYNGRTIKGVSYNANLVVQRVFNQEKLWVAPYPHNDTIWKNILDPDNDNDYTEPSSADIISCSWGANASDGDYTSSSLEVDKTILGENGKAALVVFAAGNDGHTIHPRVNQPATAKNAITVGASADYFSSDNKCQHGWDSSSDDLYVMQYSSRGTDDGRVKPDILAPGSDITSSVLGNIYISWDGTSMAAPHVSAVAAQLLKQYPSLSPAGIKAFLLSNAVGGSTTNNFDYDQGWGRLDAYRALYKLTDEYADAYDEGTVGEPGSGYSQDVYYNITIPAGADQLIVTLVWSDLPGDASQDGSKTLYNDLDLYLRNNTGQIIEDFREDDDVNNVEKYVIDNPAAGTWEAHVSVIDLNGSSGTQDYAINYQIIKESTTPNLDVVLYLEDNTISVLGTTTVYATVDVDGLSGYDISADLDVSSGLTITSHDFDGSDSDKDKVGNIPAGGNRITRTWTIRGDSSGSKSVSITVNGTRIDGVSFSDSDSITLTVEENTQTLTISNTGDSNLSVTSITDNRAWITSISPTSFTVTPNSNQTVSVTVNPDGYSPGPQDGTISIYSNDPDENPKTISVTMNIYCIDNDGDGYNDFDATWCSDGTDCDDSNANIHPDAIEICDNVDNDCDDSTDEGCDDDNDNYCDDAMSCSGSPSTCSAGYCSNLDCNDNNIDMNPGETEDCDDSIDNDCDGDIDCDDSDCSSDPACLNSDGESCTLDSDCQSNYCDNDGVGLSDDSWCFTPYNTYFDGQETSYCEYSTDSGITDCDERQDGDDLNKCIGISYYEEECSSTCSYQDITSIFECTDADCSCTESLCDGLTTGDNITTCSAGLTYFADKCNSTAGGEDIGDNICRSSSFASGCTADGECNGLASGTGSCNSACNYIQQEQNLTILNFNLLKIMDKTAIFEFEIFNNDSETQNITWNLNTGYANISNGQTITLDSNATIISYVEYTYSNDGEYVVDLTVNNDVSKQINVTLLELDVSNLILLNATGLNATFEFLIKNLDDCQLSNVSFKFDTGESNITSNEYLQLSSEDQAIIYINHHYANSGTYEVSAFAYNNTINDTEKINITI